MHSQLAVLVETSAGSRHLVEISVSLLYLYQVIVVEYILIVVKYSVTFTISII